MAQDIVRNFEMVAPRSSRDRETCSIASFLTSARLPKQDEFTKLRDRDRPDLVIPRLYIQKKARIYSIVHDFDLLTRH